MDLTEENLHEVAEKFANLTASKEYTTVKILEDLGQYLTDKNLGRRKIGVNFLSQFLSQLPKDCLSAEECRLFASFYQDRINDHHSMIPFIIQGNCKK